MLPKELMDDCNCLLNVTTPKPFELPQNASLSNETLATLDPLLKEMLGIDPKIYDRPNDIDRRQGSVSRAGDHFTSTPKPVSFKSMWDEIFGTSEQPPALNGSQTMTNATEVSTPTQNTTDLPFIWDFLTTEADKTNGSTDGFTDKPMATNKAIPSSLPQSMSHLKHFTAGVQYEDEANGTTVTSDPNQTSTVQPSSWTRPFYRPDRRRTLNEVSSTTTVVSTETPLTIGNSFFRPTLKPILRPQTTSNESNPLFNTVPPYDRRYGVERPSVSDFESRSRMVTNAQLEKIEQTRDEPYVEQQIEPIFASNRTKYPQIDSSHSTQPYRRPPYRPSVQNLSQTAGRLRPNVSQYSPDDQQVIEQQTSSPPTSWGQRHNISQPYTPSRTILTGSRNAKSDPNWWDQRYEPEAYPMVNREMQPKGQSGLSHTYPAQYPRSQPSDYSQIGQTRAKTPRVLLPGVVYVDDQRGSSPHYKTVGKDVQIRPYYQPNTTASKTYPQPYQSPYSGRQTPLSAKNPHIPSRVLYSRPELVDRSYVPYYNPYMSSANPPQIVVGEYPYLYNIDHSGYPSSQYVPSTPYMIKGQRKDPFERRRIASPSKTNYDTIRRSGRRNLVKPDNRKPESFAEPNQSDLKTISQIIESPDLTIGDRPKTFGTLKDLVNGSGLWDALNRPTTFITIFMPTDDAFNSTTDGSVDRMRRNPKLVKDFLTQHILGYSLPPQNLRNNMRVKSLNGEMHLINVIEGGKVSLV